MHAGNVNNWHLGSFQASHITTYHHSCQILSESSPTVPVSTSFNIFLAPQLDLRMETVTAQSAQQQKRDTGDKLWAAHWATARQLRALFSYREIKALSLHTSLYISIHLSFIFKHKTVQAASSDLLKLVPSPLFASNCVGCARAAPAKLPHPLPRWARWSMTTSPRIAPPGTVGSRTRQHRSNRSNRWNPWL